MMTKKDFYQWLFFGSMIMIDVGLIISRWEWIASSMEKIHF